MILTLNEEQLQQNIVSSFPGIRKTLLHMWDAESIWWQRMKLSEQIIRPSTASEYTINEVTKGIFQQDRQWEEWVSEATEAALNHVFAYQNAKREQFKQPIFQMLLHVFNHSTYHRGQLVTMLRQLGVENIQATDFIVWSRGKRN
jgi:uncharacterized damage-inducible protein DinB